jgi:hypothetical protein
LLLILALLWSSSHKANASANLINLRKELKLNLKSEVRPWIIVQWIRDMAPGDTLVCDSLSVSGNLEFTSGELDTIDVALKFVNVEFLGDVKFGRKTFRRSLSFDRVVFQGSVDFEGSEFQNHVRFHQASFHKMANFGGASFRRRANFDKSSFHGIAYFFGASFEGWTSFTKSILQEAMFHEAKFLRAPNMTQTRFETEAGFLNTKFEGGADFWSARFLNAKFWNTEFLGRANFRQTQFQGTADFLGVRFQEDAVFDAVDFRDGVSFKGGSFNRTTVFTMARFAGEADFEKAQFLGATQFDDAKFEAPSYFMNSEFNDRASFQNLTFQNGADFSFSTFLSSARFGGTFGGIWNLRESKFEDRLDLRNVSFAETVAQDKTGIVVDFWSCHSLLVGWNQLERRILFHREASSGDQTFQSATSAELDLVRTVYSNFQRNFREEGRYDDEDACLYELKTIERQRAFLDGAWGDYLIHLVLWSTCGYGTNPGRTISMGIGTILLFALAFSQPGAVMNRNADLSQKERVENPTSGFLYRFWDGLSLSVQSFARSSREIRQPTLEPVKVMWMKIPVLRYHDLAAIEGLIGLILSIFLIVTLGRIWIR